MAGKDGNGAAKGGEGADEGGDAKAPETAPEGGGSETVEGSAGPEAGAQARTGRGRGRRGNQPASAGSAADKSRKKKKEKKAKPPSADDFMMVGEVVHIAFGKGGKDSIPPAELIAAWEARIAAWHRVHGAS
ncbi:MAG: hypothetical protein GY769_20045 [bacterium]|nr:hypothetical protein [bacterium]